MTAEPCIHELDPATCSLCKGGTERRITRSPSGVRQDRYFSCPVCDRSLPETKFPTGEPGERLTERCRECRDYLVNQRKRGVSDEDALDKRRRQFQRR
jgi:hypothetical protein